MVILTHSKYALYTRLRLASHLVISFQITIRVLGGLLSAYHLSEDQIFLERATELADRILPVFETPSGLPLSMINLGLRKGVDDPNHAGLVSTAEAATLQLELRYLSHLTDNEEYWEKAEGVHSFSQTSLRIHMANHPTGHENY